MANKKKQKKPTILTCERQFWDINPITRVVQNRKGKGAYNRQEAKKVVW